MGINVFTASGRCGSDMTVKYTQAGKAIGDFSLPVETGYGDNKKTSWVTCKVFGERAEKLAQYIKKGSPVTVTGAFQLDEWDSNGQKHSRPVILVNDVQLPPQQASSQAGQQTQVNQQHFMQRGSPQLNPNVLQQQADYMARNPQPAYQDMDDTIPF